ncbi:MAG: hypothetical protein PF542_01760 [Nanoarchaeota archaeon]|jgi:hypothetical protein|nr:hypothetical protein [Nanoarchaeota archaeon]
MTIKDSKEMVDESLLFAGMMIIVIGFISLKEMTAWQVIISGIAIMGIGIFRFLKHNPKFKYNTWGKKK